MNAHSLARKNALRKLCGFATANFLSFGMTDEILQKLETWLQCRQQVAMDLSSGNLQIEVPCGNSETPAMKSNHHNS